MTEESSEIVKHLDEGFALVSRSQSKINKWKIAIFSAILPFAVAWATWVTISVTASNNRPFDKLVEAVENNTESNNELRVVIARLEERIKNGNDM